ncbi:MAG: polysaccharide biosynthesis tyrosine autokinase [Gemmatimonadales bacterium]
MERLPAGDSRNELVPGSTGAIETAVNYGGLEEEQEPVPAASQVARLISAVLRYKWLVLAIAILGTVGSVAATRFVKPSYRTAGTIFVEAATKSRGGPIRPDELLQQDSWIELIRSYAVLDSVVLKTKLYLSFPAEDSAAFASFDLATRRHLRGTFDLRIDEAGRRYSLVSNQGSVVDTGIVGDSIGVEGGFKWAPTASQLGKNREIRFTIRPPREASADLLSELRTVMPGKDGVFIQVSLTGADPTKIATVLNMILDEFMELASNLKRDKLTQIRLDLESQLRTADSTMRFAETALEAYRMKTITEPREDVVPLPSGLASTQATVLGGYFGKRQLLSQTRRDRKAIEEVIRRGQSEGMVPVDALHTIAAVRQAPGLVSALGDVVTTENELRAQRLRYTDSHKTVQDLLTKLDELRNKTVPTFAQRLVDQLRTDEAEMERDLVTQAEELKQVPVRSLTEERYRREANSAIGLSGNLQNRLTDAKLAELSATPDVSILDRADIPSRPSSNTAPRIILMGVAASIGLALLLAILLDRLDKRFRYPEQATHELKLGILGAVPVIPSETRGLRSPADTAQIVEAFRSIRLNLAHSFPADLPIVVTITSPGPGDGKSLISANLAVSFAEAGFETLLIDGDTRRGEQYRTFGVERRPGLLDYLDQRLAADRVIYQTQHPRLSLIPAGTRMQRGPELLGSARMHDLMDIARRRFQVVLVDSPPLGAGVDPFVLGTATGTVAVVLRAGETDRQLAEAKLQLLDRLPIRKLGAILNHVEVGFGAYRHYAYEYNTGEVDVDETPIPEPTQPPARSIQA